MTGNDKLGVRMTAAGVPVPPSTGDWTLLARMRRGRSDALSLLAPQVDVVVPVYRGYAETMACLFAAAVSTIGERCEIVVINDASPDDRLVTEMQRLSDDGAFTLLHNDQNLGFVRTVNRGMAVHPSRDIVLLNSDALVYGDWLHRVRQAAASMPKVATVTPLSNNAEICSYPEFIKNNTQPLEISDSTLDSMAAACNEETYIPIPTGVGFCMYVSRACLNDIGDLDASKFGKGYGEENDFCLRATVRGWVHLLASNVFVRHCGGVSFGAAKHQLVEKGLRVLAKDWPNYGKQIHEFITADPALKARRRIDVARLERIMLNRRAMLFVTHDWGGGIERYIQDLIQALKTNDVDVLVMRSVRGQEGHVIVEYKGAGQLPNLRYDLRSDERELIALFASAAVFHIHVHSFAGYPIEATALIARVAARLHVAYDFTAHDYLPICPRITMINQTGVYCGDPSAEECARCVAEMGASVPVDSITRYRDRYARFLRGARVIFAPSEDTKRRYTRWFPFVNAVVRPHMHKTPGAPPAPVRYRGDGTLRVAVIGAIGPHKGSSLLLACARDARARGLRMRFVVFGITDRPELSRHPLVRVTGKYEEGEIGALLRDQRCHLALFASVWPETWCYTLGAALDAGLFPVSFGLGALAERIRAIGWGACLPAEMMVNAPGVNDALLAVRVPAFTADTRARIRRTAASYPSPLRDYYGLAC